jgi:putative endonuclease
MTPSVIPSGAPQGAQSRDKPQSCDSQMPQQKTDVRIYYVYMLRCIDGSFYVGVTNDVERRYNEHCAGHDKTSYTFTRRPLRLVYVDEFQSPVDAISFEKRLKSWTHMKKRAFADKDWPLLKRLFKGR